MAEISKDKWEQPAEEMASFMLELAKEGDRSAVVLGAARIDVALEDLLKSIMRPHPGGSDNLFDPDRPLGTFSSKISLAFRLSLIDSEFEHALQMIRKIRNDFAHSTQKLSLSEAREKDRVRDLIRVVGKVGDRFHQLREILSHRGSPELVEFSVAVCVLLVSLIVTTDRNQTFTPARTAQLRKLEPKKPAN